MCFDEKFGSRTRILVMCVALFAANSAWAAAPTLTSQSVANVSAPSAILDGASVNVQVNFDCSVVATAASRVAMTWTTQGAVSTAYIYLDNNGKGSKKNYSVVLYLPATAKTGDNNSFTLTFIPQMLQPRPEGTFTDVYVDGTSKDVSVTYTVPKITKPAPGLTPMPEQAPAPGPMNPQN